MTSYWDGSYPPSVLTPEPPIIPDPEEDTPRRKGKGKAAAPAPPPPDDTPPAVAEPKEPKPAKDDTE